MTVAVDRQSLISYFLPLTSALASPFGRGGAAKGGDGEGNRQGSKTALSKYLIVRISEKSTFVEFFGKYLT